MTTAATRERQARWRARLSGEALERYRGAGCERQRRFRAARRRVTVALPVALPEPEIASPPTMPLILKALDLDPCQSLRAVPSVTTTTTSELPLPRPSQGKLALGQAMVLGILGQYHLGARLHPDVVARKGPVWRESSWLAKDQHDTWAKYGAQLMTMDCSDPQAVADQLEPEARVTTTKHQSKPVTETVRVAEERGRQSSALHAKAAENDAHLALLKAAGEVPAPPSFFGAARALLAKPLREASR